MNKVIPLCDGYRLARRDARNWELQEFREPNPDSGGRKSASGEPKWYGMGKFYQNLAPAILAVYEKRIASEGMEQEALKEALDRAETIASELKSVAVNLNEGEHK